MRIFKTIQALTEAHISAGELVFVKENGAGDDSKVTIYVIVPSTDPYSLLIANGNGARLLGQLDQIPTDVTTNYEVLQLIAQHNAESSSHLDIRGDITDLEAQVASLEVGQNSGVIVFQTLALLNAYTPADTTEQKGSFKVVNDPSSSNNGYYAWVSGTTYIKDADLTTGVIAEGNTDAVSGGAVYIETDPIKETTRALLPNLGGTSVISGWASGTITGDTSPPAVLNYVIRAEVTKNYIATNLSCELNSTSDFELRAYTRVGDTYTKVRHVELSGVVGTNNIDVMFPVYIGEYLGVYQKTASTIKFSTETTPEGERWVIGAGDSFTDVSAETGKRLSLSVSGTDVSQLGNRVSSVEDVISSQLLSDKEVALGYKNLPIPVGARDLTRGTWVQGLPVTSDGYLVALKVAALLSGTLRVSTYTRSNNDFTKVSTISVPVVSGYNDVAVNLKLSEGDYLGFYEDVPKIVSQSDDTPDDGGWFFGNGSSDLVNATFGTSARLHIAYEVQLFNRTESNSSSSRPIPISLPFEYMMLIGAGQSLMEGSQTATSGTTPITTAQEYDSLTFPYGNFPNTLLPATVQNSQAPTDRGEWSGLGCAAKIREFLLDNYNLGYLDIKSTVVVTNEGSGGKTIEELSKGTAKYESGISKAANLANVSGGTSGVVGILWMQGEANTTSTTEDYTSKLVTLASDYVADTTLATGQTLRPKLYTYQLSSVNRGVGIAHLRASEFSDDVVLATPMYHLGYYDDKHIDSVSERLVGAYFARSVIATLSGNKFEPLKPTHANVLGNSITLTFNKAGLALDTTLVPQQTNFGFAVENGVGANQSISSVEVVNTNQVRITLSSAPSNDWVVKYGTAVVNKAPQAGVCGNLRDSAGEGDVFDGYPLHNWCVVFDWKL